MAHIPESSSVVLLERPGSDAGVPLRSGDRVGSAWRPGGEVPFRPIPVVGSPFRAPALGLLAAASILEGYRWLGIIPVGDSRVTSLVSGRIGALPFAALALMMASAVTRSGARGHRPLTQRAVVIAAVAVVVTAVVLLISNAGATRYAFGMSDLALASAAAGALIAIERQKVRARQPVPPASGTAGTTDRIFPIV